MNHIAREISFSYYLHHQTVFKDVIDHKNIIQLQNNRTSFLTHNITDVKTLHL